MKYVKSALPLIAVIVLCLIFFVLVGLTFYYPPMHQRWLDTRLWSASKRNNFSEVSRLAQQGANINGRDKDGNPLLTEALSWGYLDTARVLLRNKPNVNAVNPKAGVTSLMLASGVGADDIVVDLVSQGANVNAQSYSGNTALIVAAVERHSTIVAYLLKHGADPNIHDVYGNTALIKVQKRLNDTFDAKRKLEYEAVVKLLQ